jgi:hypothetical protein
LPEVSEAEIEALFRDAEPGPEDNRPDSAPNIRFAEATVPIQSQTLPSIDLGPDEAAMISDDDLAEILDGDVVDADLEIVDVAESAAIEPIDDDFVEVSAADLDTPDAEGMSATDTLPVPHRPPAKPMPHASVAPVLMATPVLGAVPVAGMPVAGIPRAATAPIASPVPAPALPLRNDPIPPPTPPAKAPINDVDLDALLEDALDEAPSGEDTAAPPVDGARETHDAAPVCEDDLDLMALFEDDSPAQAADEGEDAIEVVEDVEFLFEDEPPAESAKKR